MKTCTIDWCKGKYIAKWYCVKHYARFKNNWDPLVVKFMQKTWRLNHYLYRTYRNMKERVSNVNSKAYKYYWWRGIIVCDRWLWVDWFEKFIEDMWDRPEWKSLDRIDNNWPYSPENCRRANNHQQQANTRINKKIVWVHFSKHSNRYISIIWVNWKQIYLWCFKTIEDAAIERRNAEIKYNVYK